MRIESVGTRPKFGTTVRYIHNERYGETLLKNKPFQFFINKLANNGKTSTAIFIPEKINVWVWDKFAAVCGIKDRKTGKWIGQHSTLIRRYESSFEYSNIETNHLAKYGLEESYLRAEHAPLNNLEHGYLNICVTDEIDGKVHLAHSTVDMNQNAAMAEFEYLAAESILPDNPIDVDPRLNKYLVPKPESRVVLMYEKEQKNLYKDENFISFMEWLDTSATKGENIIVNPQRKYPGILNTVDICTVKHGYNFSLLNCRKMYQELYSLNWKGPNFDLARVKDSFKPGQGIVSWYYDTVTPFNANIPAPQI